MKLSYEFRVCFDLPDDTGLAYEEAQKKMESLGFEVFRGWIDGDLIFTAIYPTGDASA